MTERMAAIGWKGSQCRLKGGRTVIRNENDWNKLWKETSTEPLPSVNFAENMVVGLCIGPYPTGGYVVDITGYREEAGKLLIDYLVKVPGDEAVTTQGWTHPWAMLVIAQSELEIVFRHVGSAPPS
jgi:hypothetical protein